MHREELIERARALVPTLRARADAAEILRRVPDETIADLVAAGFPRICQPERFGGGQCGWDALCAATMELAHGDGAQAWVANVYAEHNFLLALFPDQAQHEVWGDNPDALISASVLPAGNTVERANGGYVLSGRWSFLSGVYHSQWSILGEFVRDGETAQHHFFLVPARDRSLIDDWHALGMAGTGSASVMLDRVFVPAHRSLSSALINRGATPGAEVNTAPIYRMPMLGFSHLALGTVPVGIAEAMIEDFAEFIRSKRGPGALPLWTGNIHGRIAEAAAEARAARLMVLDAAGEMTRKLNAGDPLTAMDSANYLRDSAYACQLSRRAASRLFEAVGAHGVFAGSPMQRAFRDIYAATVHAGLNWDRATDVYGRLMTGLPPAPPRF
jgi:alkylation response protein AidB-like acyl-CoA dehydrogenase